MSRSVLQFILSLTSAILFPSILQSMDPLSLIQPSALWPDNHGHHIQAHGGGIIKLEDTYYWFGEDRGGESGKHVPLERVVSCYSSRDLTNWTFRNQVLRTDAPIERLGNPYVLERPKVYHNALTRKFVMYVHLDSADYKLAEVAVFISDTVDGDYQFERNFRPLGKESRDIGQFIDDDGTAYLIFESRPTKGFYIAKLSEDYLDVAEETSFIAAPLEGGALVHYEGLYYIIGSYLTGWNPNNNKYATASSLKGPWSEFKEIAPPETKTWNSQSTMMLKVVGTEQTSVIFMGDQWRPEQQRDSRYLWMPLEIGEGRLWLPQPRPWSINIKTGEVTYPEVASR